MTLAGADARRTWRQAPAVRAGSARRANRSHPSTPARTPGVSVPRASSLDHSPPTSRRWIRRPPHRRVERIMGAARGRPMIPFEKVAGRWKGGGFLGEPDQEFADCQQSVMARPSPPCSRSEWGGGPSEGWWRGGKDRAAGAPPPRFAWSPSPLLRNREETRRRPRLPKPPQPPTTGGPSPWRYRGRTATALSSDPARAACDAPGDRGR